MSTEAQPSSFQPTAIALPAASIADMSTEASRLGLSVEAYVLGIHAVQTGRISKQTLETIGKLFARDDEILRELAK